MCIEDHKKRMKALSSLGNSLEKASFFSDLEKLIKQKQQLEWKIKRLQKTNSHLKCRNKALNKNFNNAMKLMEMVNCE